MDIEKRLQPRDIEVINLVNITGLISSRQIKSVLFNNVSEIVMIRRLKFLSDNKFINRSRYGLENGTNGYVYYPIGGKKPSKKLLFHDLTVIEFYVNVLSAGIDVVDFKRPYSIGSIISDGYLEYKTQSGVTKRALIEIQRTGKIEECVSKYNDIKNTIINERRTWNTMPILVVISDLNGLKPTLRSINVKYMNKNTTGIREVLF